MVPARSLGRSKVAGSVSSAGRWRHAMTPTTLEQWATVEAEGGTPRAVAIDAGGGDRDRGRQAAMEAHWRFR